MRALLDRIARYDGTPPERRCAYCDRGWRQGGRLVNHYECWVACGFSPQCMTESGEWYDRSDPVPKEDA